MFVFEMPVGYRKYHSILQTESKYDTEAWPGWVTFLPPFRNENIVAQKSPNQFHSFKVGFRAILQHACLLRSRFFGEVTVGKALRDIPAKGAAEETYNMLDSISSPFIVRSCLSRQNS